MKNINKDYRKGRTVGEVLRLMLNSNESPETIEKFLGEKNENRKRKEALYENQ